MGTNVYAIKKNPRTLFDWEKYEMAISNRDPWTLKDVAEDIDSLMDGNKVHIGKRSFGWKFMFDFNNWIYYDHTEESIRNYLESVWSIEDEYGNPMTIDEFWEDFALCNPTGFTGETYEKEQGTAQTRADAKAHDWYESIYSPAGEIPKDLPYRFSNFTDFS